MIVVRKHQKGFTLIELLIVVAVIGILAAVAIPSYRNYVLQSRRADGQAALLALAMAQAKFRVNCPYFAANIGGADTCGASAAASTVKFSSTSTDGYYTIGMASASSTGFIARADARGSQTADNATCPKEYFRITENGPDKSDPNAAEKKVCWGAR